MAGTKLKLGAVFVIVWLVVLVALYSRFQSGELLANEQLNIRLRKALEDVKMLTKRNEELEKAVSGARHVAASKVDGEIDRVKKEIDETKDKLNKAVMSKEECQEKIGYLESQVDSVKALHEQGHEFIEGGKHGINDTPGEGPSLEHELAIFKLADNIQEVWYYLKSNLKKLGAGPAAEILEDVGHRHRSIQVDVLKLSQVDNNEAWREQEHASLQSLMQRRLQYLQNPKDCSKAKKLLCDLNKGCGFGCQLHHAIYCFMIAYGTERTMILQSKGWRYASHGWESVFLPLSDSCTQISEGQHRSNWNGEEAAQSADVVVMPIVDALHRRPPYMPLSIPEDLAPRLRKLHGDPSVWFISQFVKYMMRPQPHLQEDLKKVKDKINFENPIVGIHVRRTDKVGTEAAYHGIEEYMEHIDEWFLRHERVSGPIDKRRVYIASDDASVLPDAQKRYPDYEFYGDASIAQSAGLGSRYSDNSLRGVIIDIHMLSLTNYLVCTFSSQVCRVAYEIMQTLHPDAAHWFHSLDDIFYFGGQLGHEETALYKHDPKTRDEIALEVGDIVGIAGNHWDGYSKGQNRRTGGIGLYPSYKTEDKKFIVKYPIYEQVPLTET